MSFKRDMKTTLRKLGIIRTKIIAPSVDAGQLTVIHVEPDADNLKVSLGISAERGEELQRKVIQSYDDSKNLVTTANKFSKECKHANELFFCSYILSQHHTHIQNVSGLFSAMGGMFGGKRHE